MGREDPAQCCQKRGAAGERCHFCIELIDPEILTASDRAATLLLVGDPDQRIPIQLTPKEVTVIRH